MPLTTIDRNSRYRNTKYNWCHQFRNPPPSGTVRSGLIIYGSISTISVITIGAGIMFTGSRKIHCELPRLSSIFAGLSVGLHGLTLAYNGWEKYKYHIYEDLDPLFSDEGQIKEDKFFTDTFLMMSTSFIAMHLFCIFADTIYCS